MVLKEQLQLRKIQKGDIASFEALFHQYYSSLCGYAESLVGMKEVAEEVIQDVFYNIWKNRESLRIRQSLKSYLYRAAFNNSMMHLRKMRREHFMEDLSRPEPGTDAPDPSQLIQLDEVSGLIQRTLEGIRQEKTRARQHPVIWVAHEQQVFYLPDRHRRIVCVKQVPPA